MNDVSNLNPTIVAKSDQLNADDLMGGPITVTVQAVKAGDKDQPISIQIDGGHQPFKPCKSMRRVLIFCWGDDGRKWAGKSMTLFNDPTVTWAGVMVGGIRISHISDIDSDITIALTKTRGKKLPTVIKKLVMQQPAPAPIEPGVGGMYPAAQFEKALPTMQGRINTGKMTVEQVIEQCEKTGKLSDEQKAQIKPKQEF